MGIRLVDTYVPWGVHEIAPGQLELGRGDPQRDVGAFLRLCDELGLYAIVRPGPAHQRGAHVLRHPGARRLGPELPGPLAAEPPGDAPDAALRVPGAELRQRGVPRRDGALLPPPRAGDPAPALPRRARGPAPDRQRGRSLLPRRGVRPGLPPRRDPPVPRLPPREVRDARALAGGVSHAGARARPGPSRRGRRVRRGAPLRHPLPAHPLRRGDPGDLARHLDWTEFHEHLLETAFERFARALADAGIDGLPTTHNLPPGQEATPLNAGARHPLRRPGRARLLPGRQPGEPRHRRAPHHRARRAHRGARAACVRLRDGRRLPALLPPDPRARQRLHRARRARVRPARLQRLHGRRARPLDRRADRSARPPAPLRRSSGASSQRRSSARRSSGSRGGRRCASSPPAASAGSPA